MIHSPVCPCMHMRNTSFRNEPPRLNCLVLGWTLFISYVCTYTASFWSDCRQQRSNTIQYKRRRKKKCERFSLATTSLKFVPLDSVLFETKMGLIINGCWWMMMMACCRALHLPV